MANPSPSYFQPTGDAVIDGMTNGFFWSMDSSRTIDFSISRGFSGEAFTYPTQLLSTLSDVLSTYAIYANVRFNQLGAFDSPLAASRQGSEINLSKDIALKFFQDDRT